MTPTDSAYLHNKQGIAFYRDGQYDNAIAAFHAAIDEAPNYADAYYNLGLALMKSSRRVEAVHVFEALLLLVPGHLGAQFQLAMMLMHREQNKEAIVYFKHVISDYPEHVESMINLATCYLRIGELIEARAWYERALLLAPDDTFVLYNLGVISAYQGRVREAIDYYLQALKLDSQLHDAHNNLAVVYLGLSDAASALNHFRAALSLRPDNEAVRHSIRILTDGDEVDSSPAAYIQSLFDSYAGHYDAHLLQTLAYQVPRELFDVVRAHDDRASYAVLDLGCGTGLCGELFKPVASSMIGVDLSQKMLDVAAGKHLYDELVMNDVVQYLERRAASQFDLVMAGDVLVYFGELREVFALIAKVLKPGGLFVFNAEIAAQDDFILMSSGRFAHHQRYLDQLAMNVGLNKIAYRNVMVRRQNDSRVVGHVYLLQKPR